MRFLIRKRWVLALGLCLLTTADALAFAQVSDNQLKVKLSSLMKKSGGSSGAWAYDTDSGKLLFRWRPAARRIPASNQKIFTTAAALGRWGPNYRFSTVLYGSGQLNGTEWQGNLYLKGSGDPSLASDEFADRYLGSTSTSLDLLVQRLEELGIESVTGRVYGDEGHFDTKRGGPASGYATSPYVGPLSALAVNMGYAGSSFQSKPASFAATKLAEAMRADGIDVKRAGKTSSTPNLAVKLAEAQSPPLEKLVRRTNKISDNFFAEMLAKGLGASFGGRGSTAAGSNVVEQYAQEQGVGIDTADGSGLSRANSTSPQSVGKFLVAISKSPLYKPFYKSLPIAGIDGTLHSRMRRGPARGRVRAKTGTLSGVSSLSGYARSDSGDLIAFSLLMNNVNVYSARQIQDSIAHALADYDG